MAHLKPTSLRFANTLSLVALALLFACDDSATMSDAASSDDRGDGSIGAPDAAAPEPPGLLALPPKGRGIQFRMTTSLPAGSESEHCKFVRAPEDLIVNHDEIRFTQGSHHVLLFTTAYEDVPVEDLLGEPVDTSGVFDCSEGIQGIWDATGLVAVSQSAHGQSAISFPEGIGARIAKGTILLINVHYINATEEKLDPEVDINLHTIPEDELTEEGGLLFWYNPFLKAPANDRSVMSASCPITQDIHLTNLQAHMHRRGTGYAANVITPDGERSEIYRSDTWEEVPVDAFEPNLEVAKGSRIEWHCEYENPEAHDVYQGPRSTDEMCMLIGSYYPHDPELGFCAQRGAAFFGANWHIGQGTASCAETFSCVAAASSENSSGGAATGSGAQALTTSITECLLASSPELVEPVSNMLGCLASAPSDADPLADCSAEIADCTAQ